jgi:hypothetical protein
MEKGSSMEEFLLEMKILSIQIGGIGDLINDKNVVLIVLNTCHPNLKVFCKALFSKMKGHHLKRFQANCCKKIIYELFV